ncbi:hypothetical protein acdb102_37410 [Acidothermaceae bacterium B102]|nr:hypothetical protein acdb102_37410 [Acidothermaceae bacterium B102]
MRTRWMKVNLLLVPLVSLGLIGATAATASASTSVAPRASVQQLAHAEHTYEIASGTRSVAITAAQADALRFTLLHPGAAAHTDSTHHACVRIYRWQIEALGWLLVVDGVVVGAVGGFIDASVIGIPVGAVLNAVGLGYGASGAFVIWWADTHFPTSRVYCITWT